MTGPGAATFRGRFFSWKTMRDILIRDASRADIPAIAAIYGQAVTEGTASFELQAPDETEMERRFETVIRGGFPYLVAESAGRVIGYAYAGLYRTRPAYRFTVENSVYVAPAHQGRGAGRALLERLIGRCTEMGYRQMIAVIGDEANTGSIALHRACGFELRGVLKDVGWKHGSWRGTVEMQRALGDGGKTPPPEGA
ncbi:MAG: N-acetyltransferase family protein [Flavobacteriaceae bacterium]